MWEALLIQITKEVIVPELMMFIKKKFEDTGEWPTKAELEAKVNALADTIINEGNDFLNRDRVKTPRPDKLAFNNDGS